MTFVDNTLSLSACSLAGLILMSAFLSCQLQVSDPRNDAKTFWFLFSAMKAANSTSHKHVSCIRGPRHINRLDLYQLSSYLEFLSTNRKWFIKESSHECLLRLHNSLSGRCVFFFCIFNYSSLIARSDQQMCMGAMFGKQLSGPAWWNWKCQVTVLCSTKYR